MKKTTLSDYSHDNILYYDAVIVGGGPAGLACAIRLGQLMQHQHPAPRFCLIEKAAQIGGHSLSGAILDPRAFYELLPNQSLSTFVAATPVRQEAFYALGSRRGLRLFTPKVLHNTGHWIISLGQFCRALAKEAEALGVDIYTSFNGASLCYNDQGAVCGVVTGESGIDKAGKHTERYQPGVLLRAKHTILAEGCRGSLTQQSINDYQQQGASPQTYALGFKELWEIDPAVSQCYTPGTVIHTLGWPLDHQTYGGGFLYCMDHNKVSVGFAVGLDYTNPYLDPHNTFQQFKTHAYIRPYLQAGKRLAYGARAINEGGWQSLPKLASPGASIIGCGAGFVNVPKLKGIHTAMKSGMVLAETLVETLAPTSQNQTADTSASPLHLTTYQDRLLHSWVGSELYRFRNIRPAFRWGLPLGLLYSGLDLYLLRGKAPWTLGHTQPDHTQLQPAANCQPISYPPYDNQLTFDKPSSVYLSNTYHEDNQPCHLHVDQHTANWQQWARCYDLPETRYCPAGVYERVPLNQPQAPLGLHINPTNCLHCKACDIKDPGQQIKWHPPQGGDGPHYEDM